MVEQHRILARLLRKHALGQAGDEDDAERAAAGLVRTADEHGAVARSRRLRLQREQPIGQHISRLVERHRSDLAHRPQLGEHAQDIGAVPEHVWREILEAVEPFAPGRRRRPLGQPIDQRKCERAQVREVSQIPREPLGDGRLGILTRFFRDPQPELPRQAVEAPVPAAGVAADHRRFDDQRLPLPRGAQRPLDDRHIVCVLDRMPGRSVAGFQGFRFRGFRGVRLGREVGDSAERIVGRCDEVRGCPSAIELRDLTEREILGEASRGQPFDRAAEDGQKRAAGRMRPLDAAVEPDRNARSPARVLEETQVVLRRPQQDGDVVQRDAALCLLEDPARNLGTFAPFAGCGEEPDIAGWRPFRRPPSGEQVASECGQIRRSVLLQDLWLDAECSDSVERGTVAKGHGHQDRRRLAHECPQKVELSRRVHRHIEQH